MTEHDVDGNFVIIIMSWEITVTAVCTYSSLHIFQCENDPFINSDVVMIIILM